MHIAHKNVKNWLKLPVPICLADLIRLQEMKAHRFCFWLALLRKNYSGF